MSATYRAYQHALKRIAKIAWEAQEVDGLSPTEQGELECIINYAMEAAGTELPLSEFVKGVDA